MYLVGARKQENGSGPETSRWRQAGWWCMRGRFFGSINAWYKRRGAGVLFESIASKPRATPQHRESAGDGMDGQLPQEMPKTVGRRKPRSTRGFPMWAFLAISPRAGRNARPLPRKFRARGCRIWRACRLRSA